MAKCEGHSSYVKAIDWAINGKVLMSTCGAYDLLFFDPRSGRKLRTAQNDTRWATWTCKSWRLGFRSSEHSRGVKGL